jgi:hypothetical protein
VTARSTFGSIVDAFRRDIVTELVQFPNMEVGGPSPLILIDEHRLALAYYLNAHPSSDGTYEVLLPAKVLDEGPSALVKLEFGVMRFGYPNSERPARRAQARTQGPEPLWRVRGEAAELA